MGTQAYCRAVLVSREMESGRLCAREYNANFEEQFSSGSGCGGRKGGRPRPQQLSRKGDHFGGSHSLQAALGSRKPLATKKILNIRAAKLLNKQPCRRHHACASLLWAIPRGERRVSVSGAPVIQERSASCELDAWHADFAANTSLVIRTDVLLQMMSRGRDKPLQIQAQAKFSSG
jgi:hypothetical protein